MPIIKLENITKKYKNQNPILSKYNLEINKGEFIGLVGKSGAGKTTLLNIIGLISDPTSGNVCILNKEHLSSESKSAMLLRRNTIGYLFQNYGLIEDETVEWNLNLALEYKKIRKKEKKEKIHKLLNDFGLNNYEHKYVYQLSGGEQQRIAIIKLVLQECSIILADEPTSGLDKSNTQMVMDLLTKLNENGTTIIMVTHDLELCKYFTRTIEIIKDPA